MAILHALASSSQLVRVQASWALANLTDTLLAGTGWNLSSYLSAASNALKDKDMVQTNYLRMRNCMHCTSALFSLGEMQCCSNYWKSFEDYSTYDHYIYTSTSNSILVMNRVGGQRSVFCVYATGSMHLFRNDEGNIYILYIYI